MNRARLKLALVFAIFLGPLLAAFAWYYGIGGAPRATTNHAPLLTPPVPLRAFANPMVAGARFNLESLRRKWSIVHLLPAPCAAQCERALYHTRQARLALGRDTARVQRILLGQRAQLTRLAADHPDAIRLTPAATGLEHQLAALPHPADTVLIDPLGNAMLIIPATLAPRDLLKDLKKLLKLSRIG